MEDEAFARERDGHRMGADAVACGPECGMGHADEGERGGLGGGARTGPTSAPSSLARGGTSPRKPDLLVPPLDVPSSWRGPEGSCNRSPAPRHPPRAAPPLA